MDEEKSFNAESRRSQRLAETGKIKTTAAKGAKNEKTKNVENQGKLF